MVVLAVNGIGGRLKLVREATGLTQVRFCELLNQASRRLYGDAGPEYRQGSLTKLETGVQYATFEDVAVFALVDPRRRGKLWLAWNERRDASLGDSDEHLARDTGGVVLPPLPAPPPAPAREDVAQRPQRARGGRPRREY